MAAVAPSSRPTLDVGSPACPPPCLLTSTHAPSDTQVSATQPTPPRLLLRLPPQTELDALRHPLKRKWRSFVNFFALPIRSYYLEPPGLAYRNELRARQRNPWDDGDDHHSFWPVPAYTDQVGDDEMILFKAQEEAEALAAMQRDQQAAIGAADAAARQEELDGDASDDDHEAQGVEQLAASRDWPASQPLSARPSPQYEMSDPLSTSPVQTSASFASHRPQTRPRPRTTSNTTTPTFSNGFTMARQSSTPLLPTFGGITTPSRIRQRAQTNAASSPRPTLAGRNISEPLSWTLVRSQYSYPKRGLSAQQLAFLSSVESLGRFGVVEQAEAVPSPAYESRREEAADYGFPSVAR
ncbi:hypothetical protein PHSY_002078 [Pseudozyma hubeiensis SY62]|uniref:Uncharacterized protein n=1 Tax=Pseudozyma hubeiensis (strain SY62) TaxID=1305764 RepID=R9P061_PSEHS|nr:hypothetical protein PHSY_002078 [Pseudozyma hubeiensis SY62]GAC94506.1 hypothetical protein PHSY_002078 [Pseudozyma hubeiensis SY62]